MKGAGFRRNPRRHLARIPVIRRQRRLFLFGQPTIGAGTTATASFELTLSATPEVLATASFELVLSGAGLTLNPATASFELTLAATVGVVSIFGDISELRAPYNPPTEEQRI